MGSIAGKEMRPGHCVVQGVFVRTYQDWTADGADLCNRRLFQSLELSFRRLLHPLFQVCKYIRSETGLICLCFFKATLHHSVKGGIVQFIPCSWCAGNRARNRNAEHIHGFLGLLLYMGLHTSHYVCGFCCHSLYHLSHSTISNCTAIFSTRLENLQKVWEENITDKSSYTVECREYHHLQSDFWDG